MKTITLKNDFHNTEIRVRPGTISPATVRRVRRTLCGIPTCTCGGNLGERGPQAVEITPRQDGGAEIVRQD